MAERKIASNVWMVGAVDWTRTLFDELIPLPDGTSYNAYLIRGSEKTALIDTVDPAKGDELLRNLKEVGIDKIDYVVSNHAEQDHSGSIPKILELYPDAKVVTNQKCRNFLIDLLHIPEERFEVVGDREKLSLGDKELEFILTPWVHWPETMVTYLREEKILFSCDFFGSHLATSKLFADENIYEAAKRYYAEIMMPFRNHIQKHLKLIDELDVKVIAPSHGPIYDKPKIIVDAYRDWVSDRTKNEIVVAYVSMHNSTKVMVEYFIDAAIKRGIDVRVFNLSSADIGELTMSLVDASTVVIGSPTVLTGPHPLATYAGYLINALRPKTKFVSVIGSYSWGGRMIETLQGILSNLKAEFIEPVVVKGLVRKDDFELLDKLADKIVDKHREVLGLN